MIPKVRSLIDMIFESSSELNKKANTSDVYNKTETDTKLNTKQEKLTAGTGIEITGKNIINNLNTNYSTDEQVIGKWAQGQTLYRRIIFGTLHVRRGGVLASFPGSYRIVNFNGNILQQSNNQVKPINFWFSTTDYMQILHERTNNLIMYDCAGDYENSQIVLIIEYIKE